MKKKILISLILVSVLSFYACGEKSLPVEIEKTDSDTVVQGADDSGTLSVGKNGVFRIRENHLLFFDYDSEGEYVICSRANCRHNDESCSGWYSGYHGALGLAEYGGSLYCFIKNDKQNLYEFIRMNRDGTQRKTIAELDCGDSAPGNWELNFSVSEFYYAGNKVITILDWKYNPADDKEQEVQTSQCIAIDLQSGELIEITDRVKGEVNCNIDAVSKDYCVANVTGYEETLLTEKAFYEKYENGEFDSNGEIKKAENPYDAYYDWYVNHTNQWYRIILFDLTVEKASLLQEGSLERRRDDNGEVYAISQPFNVCSLYKDTVIIDTYEEAVIEDEGALGTVKNKVYKWDIKSGEKELLLSLDNGYVFDAGGINAGIIVDHDVLLFLKRKPELKADYYSYNLKTGERKLLYELERNVPYRITGETEDSFIYYTVDDTKKSMYMMKKADYYKGNFENSVRLEGLDETF